MQAAKLLVYLFALKTQNHNNYMKKSTINLLLTLSVIGLILLSSCGTPKDVVYFQDLKPGSSIDISATPLTLTIKPQDKLMIVVNSRDPQLMALFNLPEVRKQIVSNGGSSLSSTGQDVLGYTVDKNGEIDFPVLGKIYVAGKTREAIAEYIKSELMRENLVKDPVVTVEYLNLCVSVLGEVNNPGRYNIDRDRTTILDVLSMAGDLTINGNRTNIMVMRQDGKNQRIYGIDLTQGNNIYSSPAYYLQQNDVVYVEPNDVRIRQSTVNGNTVRSTSFWISLISLAMSVAVLITNIK